MSKMWNLKSLVLVAMGALVLTACAGARIKARKDERDRVAQTSHIYCDFVNGEVYPDVEVAMNLEMSKHCDAKSQLTISSYRSPSDAIGMVYCCGTKDVAKNSARESFKESKEKDASKDSLKDLGDLDDTPAKEKK